MSFYKNTNSNFKDLEYCREYPIGTIIKYRDIFATVEEITMDSIWVRTPAPVCQKLCAFHQICKSAIPCNCNDRKDEKNVYFKEIKL